MCICSRFSTVIITVMTINSSRFGVRSQSVFSRYLTGARYSVVKASVDKTRHTSSQCSSLDTTNEGMSCTMSTWLKSSYNHNGLTRSHILLRMLHRSETRAVETIGNYLLVFCVKYNRYPSLLLHTNKIRTIGVYTYNTLHFQHTTRISCRDEDRRFVCYNFTVQRNFKSERKLKQVPTYFFLYFDKMLHRYIIKQNGWWS